MLIESFAISGKLPIRCIHMKFAVAVVISHGSRTLSGQWNSYLSLSIFWLVFP